MTSWISSKGETGDERLSTSLSATCISSFFSGERPLVRDVGSPVRSLEEKVTDSEVRGNCGKSNGGSGGSGESRLAEPGWVTIGLEGITTEIAFGFSIGFEDKDKANAKSLTEGRKDIIQLREADWLEQLTGRKATMNSNEDKRIWNNSYLLSSL